MSEPINVAGLAQIEDRIKALVVRAENAAVRAEAASGIGPPVKEKPDLESYKKVAPLL